MLRRWLGCFCLFFVACHGVAASVPLTTTHQLTVVQKTVDQLAKTYGEKQVLVVFGLENTLLSMQQPLGSQQWVRWQEKLLDTDPSSKELAAHSKAGLRRVERLLLDIQSMRLTTEQVPSVIKHIQKEDIDTLVLTSRSPDMYDETSINLKNHHLYFSDHSLGSDFMDAYVPVNASHEVLYRQGVFFDADQSAGEMLKDLLGRFQHHYQAIVVVDNEKKTLTSVANAFSNLPGLRQLTLIRYSGEDGQIEQFWLGDKGAVVTEWQRLADELQALNPVYMDKI